MYYGYIKRVQVLKSIEQLINYGFYFILIIVCPLGIVIQGLSLSVFHNQVHPLLALIEIGLVHLYDIRMRYFLHELELSITYFLFFIIALSYYFYCILEFLSYIFVHFFLTGSLAESSQLVSSWIQVAKTDALSWLVLLIKGWRCVLRLEISLSLHNFFFLFVLEFHVEETQIWRHSQPLQMAWFDHRCTPLKNNYQNLTSPNMSSTMRYLSSKLSPSIMLPKYSFPTFGQLRGVETEKLMFERSLLDFFKFNGPSSMIYTLTLLCIKLDQKRSLKLGLFFQLLSAL